MKNRITLKIVLIVIILLLLLTLLILIGTGKIDFNKYFNDQNIPSNQPNIVNKMESLSWEEIDEILYYYKGKYNDKNYTRTLSFTDKKGNKCDVSFAIDFLYYYEETAEIGYYVSVGLNKINGKKANSQVAGSVFETEDEKHNNMSVIKLQSKLTIENYNDMSLNIPKFKEIKKEILKKYEKDCTIIRKD